VNSVELQVIVAAFERLVRLALDLDEEAEVKVDLARAENGIRLKGILIRGEPVNNEDWAVLVAAHVVQDMSGVALA
jgi:hypothetical protein